MKRIKLLPSILMLVLCVGVLAVGIYAVNPATHRVVGTISVAAAGAKVKMGIYYDATNNGISADDTLISNELSTRVGDTLTIDAEKAKTYLDFTEANYDAGIKTKNLYVKIENLSSSTLGAYFLVGQVGENGATTENIASVAYLDSKDGTIPDIIKCTFGTYTKMETGEIICIDLDISLLKEIWDGTQAELDFTLNIEGYNENIAPLENGVNVYTNGTNVEITATTTDGTTLTSLQTNRYLVNNLTLYQGTTPSDFSAGIKTYPTTKISFTITNKGTNPISVDVELSNPAYKENILKVVTLSNSYIAPNGGEGEVSVQLTVLDSAIDTLTDFALDDLSLNLDAYEITSDIVATANIQSRIQKTDTKVGDMEYYIEYGINPYYNNTPLRWFVWGKDNGSGTIVPLEDTNPITTSGTYYFISEYVLNVTQPSETNSGALAYQNDYYAQYDDYENAPGEIGGYFGASGDWIDYSTSNLRTYLNGVTVKRQYSYTDISDLPAYYDVYTPFGDAINFYESFGLTEDAIFSQIIGRDVVGSNYDKFWALSYSEAIDILGHNNSVALNIPNKTGHYEPAHWCLRTAYDDLINVWYIYDGGGESMTSSPTEDVGVRPAFKLTV